ERAGELDVVDEAAAPGQQRRILQPLDARAELPCAHAFLPPSSFDASAAESRRERAACSTRASPPPLAGGGSEGGRLAHAFLASPSPPPPAGGGGGRPRGASYPR